MGHKQAILFAIFIHAVLGHVKLKNPAPRGSGAGDYPVEYNLERPLYHTPDEGPVLPFPCGGKTKKGPSQAKYKAGETVTVDYQVSTYHGGPCQFSLDCTGQSKNFIVIKTMFDCMADRSFTVPSGAHGECVLAWTWLSTGTQNQYYMNCVDITIDGPADGTFEGPPLIIAGMPSFRPMPDFKFGDTPPFDGNGITTDPMYTENNSLSFLRFGPGPETRPIDGTSPPPPPKSEGNSTPVPTPSDPPVPPASDAAANSPPPNSSDNTPPPPPPSAKTEQPPAPGSDSQPAPETQSVSTLTDEQPATPPPETPPEEADDGEEKKPRSLTPSSEPVCLEKMVKCWRKDGVEKCVAVERVCTVDENMA